VFPTAMVCVLLPHHVAKAAACGCQHVPQVCCQAAQAGRSCAPCRWACLWCVWFDGYTALGSQFQASMCVCSVWGFKGNKRGGVNVLPAHHTHVSVGGWGRVCSHLQVRCGGVYRLPLRPPNGAGGRGSSERLPHTQPSWSGIGLGTVSVPTAQHISSFFGYGCHQP
jgi:hypothetical protein